MNCGPDVASTSEAAGGDGGVDDEAGDLGQPPLGRLGHASDIAHAVAFLASPHAGYITGTELHVNGGMYMS